MPSLAIRRLQKEYLMIEKEPVEFVKAVTPLEGNLLECHFCIQGPTDTPYEKGYYHGVFIFPPNYPFKAPEIRMMTPSGRFEVNTPLCLSISNTHPEMWDVASWKINTLLRAFISFMADNEWNHYGGRNDSEERRRQFAIESLQHCSNDAQFGELFPEVKQEIDEKIKLNEELQRKNSD